MQDKKRDAAGGSDDQDRPLQECTRFEAATVPTFDICVPVSMSLEEQRRGSGVLLVPQVGDFDRLKKAGEIEKHNKGSLSEQSWVHILEGLRAQI